MEVFEYIKELTDDELKDFVKERIEYLEDIENKPDHFTIGYCLDYKPFYNNLIKYDASEARKVNMISKFDGYIPKNTIVVYGMIYDDKTGMMSNGGRYYYVDDDSYILDFCKFIKKVDVGDSLDLFDLVFDYIQDYFIGFENIDRESMLNLIIKHDYIYYDPINENRFSMFKKKGNAMCSEIGVMAQNILSFLGYDVDYVVGTVKLDNNKAQAHAYNMVTIEDDGKKQSLLIDFASCVSIYDMDFNKIGEAPFIYYLDDLKEVEYEKMLENNEMIITNNYSYLLQKNFVWVIRQKDIKEYATSSNLKYTSEDLKSNKCKDKCKVKKIEKKVLY